MAVRDRNQAGPVTAFRASTVLGIKGDKGDAGSIAVPPGKGLLVTDTGVVSVLNDGAANQLYGMSAGGVKQYFTLTGDGSIVSGALVLGASGVTPGTYGDATHVPQITVDAKGRVTAASNVGIAATFTSTFVYQPGGVAGGNVFTDWSLLVPAVNAVAGVKEVLIDASFVGGNAHVPAGTWNVNNWAIIGGASLSGFSSGLIFDDGAKLIYNLLYAFNITLETASTQAVATFAGGNGGFIIAEFVAIIADPGKAPFIHMAHDAGGVGIVGMAGSSLGDPTNHVPVIQVDTPAQFSLQLSGLCFLFHTSFIGAGTIIGVLDCTTNIEYPLDSQISLSQGGFAPLVQYTPTTPANWASPPALVQTALDDLALPSGVTPGTYGDATHVSQVTVDAHGKVTSATNVALGGTVTVAGGTGISVTGGPNYTVALQVPVTVGDGGTGATTLANHSILLGQGASAVQAIANSATDIPCVSNGVSADPSFRALPLAGAGVTGILAASHGGTGLATLTDNAVLLGNDVGGVHFAPPVAAGNVLKDTGPGNDPTFVNPNTLRGATYDIAVVNAGPTAIPNTNAYVSLSGGGVGINLTSTEQVLITAFFMATSVSVGGTQQSVRMSTGPNGTGTVLDESAIFPNGPASLVATLTGGGSQTIYFSALADGATYTCDARASLIFINV